MHSEFQVICFVLLGSLRSRKSIFFNSEKGLLIPAYFTITIKDFGNRRCLMMLTYMFIPEINLVFQENVTNTANRDVLFSTILDKYTGIIMFFSEKYQFPDSNEGNTTNNLK